MFGNRVTLLTQLGALLRQVASEADALLGNGRDWDLPAWGFMLQLGEKQPVSWPRRFSPTFFPTFCQQISKHFSFRLLEFPGQSSKLRKLRKLGHRFPERFPSGSRGKRLSPTASVWSPLLFATFSKQKTCT